MNELITKIQGDSTMMLMAIIAVVVLLVIVLTIVVSAMRVKTYKDRWWNVTVDNEEKSEYIVALEKELQSLKIKNAHDTQELSLFAETKEKLRVKQEEFSILQKNFNEREKELSQLTAKLESAEMIYIRLSEEHKELKVRFDEVVENNAKYRTNNARLLMKLETEERYIQRLKEDQGVNDA